ncbi:hypothetical protein NE237_008045 [Protea cynaroides]|uniref:Gag protein n=1 Tax=Protea cynaroides TaxID=273540 RepID=A0A9Q0KRD2_9MAGN|nr:hypothetical protein NE237_008045 [Protea cynaroides]
MYGCRVTRQTRNAVPPPPPVEETSQENNYALGNPEPANPTNLPPPPPKLATVAAPMHTRQTSAAPVVNHPAHQTPQQPAAQIPMQAPEAAQGNHQYPPYMFGANPQNQLDHSRLVERFLKMKPREFNGKPFDPLWPAHWIDEMERNFLMLTITEEEKGQMTVDSYQQRYEELFFFAPASMQEEDTKTRRFVVGLRGSIRENILGLEKRIYNEAVQIARVIESSQKESYLTQNRGIKRPAGNSYNGGNNRTCKPFRPQNFNAATKITPAAQLQPKPNSEAPKCFNCNQPGIWQESALSPRNNSIRDVYMLLRPRMRPHHPMWSQV